MSFKFYHIRDFMTIEHIKQKMDMIFVIYSIWKQLFLHIPFFKVQIFYYFRG